MSAASWQDLGEILQLKAVCSGESRRLSVPAAEGPVLAAVQGAVAEAFGLEPAGLALEFVDEEGDACAITTEVNTHRAASNLGPTSIL
jgi:hypothetical protein